MLKIDNFTFQPVQWNFKTIRISHTSCVIYSNLKKIFITPLSKVIHTIKQ